MRPDYVLHGLRSPTTGTKNTLFYHIYAYAQKKALEIQRLRLFNRRAGVAWPAGRKARLRIQYLRIQYVKLKMNRLQTISLTLPWAWSGAEGIELPLPLPVNWQEDVDKVFVKILAKMQKIDRAYGLVETLASRGDDDIVMHCSWRQEGSSSNSR